MSDVWNAITFESVLQNVPDGPLPDCNRGSWYCPIATKEDADALDALCQDHGIDRVYDLGAGTLELSVSMDRRGYDVVAYESIKGLAEYGLSQHPENSVDVRIGDYYEDWPDIHDERAAFVALGKLNHVPGDAPNGIVVDEMGVD